MRMAVVFCTLAMGLCAQDPSTPPVESSVSGVVKDAVTAQPLARYNVSTMINATFAGGVVYQRPTTRQVQAVTDDNGRYRLAGLPPGTYRIFVRNAEEFGAGKTRSIALAGHDLDGIDFSIVRNGEISGKVVDENKEPVPGLNVMLVAREYFMGTLGYYIEGASRTNDRGEYRLGGIEPGRQYLILAEKRPEDTARSDAPLDPKLRRPAAMRTFYPSPTQMESATPLSIQPAEHRDGVNITLKKSQSYCVEGIVQGPMGPGPLRVGFEPLQPSTGNRSNGGFFMGGQSAPAAADGKFRFCDLYPGEFRITAADRFPAFNDEQAKIALAIEPVTITDHDLKNVRVIAAARELKGEVVLDGPAPATPITARANITIVPLMRNPMPGERPGGGRVEIPGEFTTPNVVPSLYGVRMNVNSPGLYVKDIDYGGRSILHEPLRFDGAATGNTLRITLGQDGATITVTVADKDGNAVPDTTVIAFPEDAASEAVLQDAIKTGTTDQAGRYTSIALAPGKYYVAATLDKINATPESLARILRNRTRFQEVDLAPNGSQSASLTPVPLDAR